MIRSLRLYQLSIPFKVAFKHHSAERAETETIWVEAEGDGIQGAGEGCPRSYVTGETLESAMAFFDRHAGELQAYIRSVDDLKAWIVAHESEIATNPAAWCAIELAIIELLALQRRGPVETILSLAPTPGSFRYSAVIGDSPLNSFRIAVQRYAAAGFLDFKIKLSGDSERNREKVATLLEQNIPGLRLRVDANNLWPDAESAIRALKKLDCALAGVEEPIAAGRFEELRSIATGAGCPIILDESLLRSDQIAVLENDPSNWIINVRVSKMGGLLRSLKVVERAREAGIPITVGAHVGETSLLTRVGLTVAQAAGDALFAHEGAFGTLLLESDVVENPLMFGRAGVLDATAWMFDQRPGWGLAFGFPEGSRLLGRYVKR